MISYFLFQIIDAIAMSAPFTAIPSVSDTCLTTEHWAEKVFCDQSEGHFSGF